MSAAWWSLLLTPLFAATLLDRNWRELGKEDSARQTRFLMWAMGIFGLLMIINAFADTTKATDKVVQGVSKIVGIAFTGFCFSIGRRQRDFLKESGLGNYSKRPWPKALALGFLGLLAFFGATSLGVFVFSNPAIEDVATESQQVISDYFKQNPTNRVSSVNSVQIQSREGHDYFGLVDLTINGDRIRQSLHVHLESGELRWETKPLAPTSNQH
ncbi:MAG: hypothetical protein P4L51_20560 [Puia sp.]|nr:hypothetical protein [Puia sp.]